MRQIAGASILRRNREDFSARREHGSLAVRRDIEVGDLLARTHPVLHGLVALSTHINDQFFSLPSLQVEPIQVAAILKNNRIGTKAWPHDIEFVELSKLLDLLAALVVAVEIEPVSGPAVGSEINSVSTPHRKRVGIVLMRDDLINDIILDVVDRNVLRQAAGVAFPLPEIAENSVVSDLCAVR